ncbi:hypothetical protein GCM10010915_29450 [Microbacterium faecale]|uniref:DUF6458 domain-containing protein n=1 Tax=Microbacterium faecale TaxID=1804630 RepID=A0A916YJ65_9MICO|nr:DUF6458 family protein [Microbacterium faecale]GGD46287.1 hypothetical protein GCM10010915_29450 [Microbacterium faecale]
MLVFGIILMVIGAIVAWAVPGIWRLEGFDWALIGYILLAAGAVLTILGIVQLVRRGRATTTTHTAVDPAAGTRTDHVERRDDLT